VPRRTECARREKDDTREKGEEESDGLAVMFVKVLFYLGTYLFDVGLHLFAVDVDVYPAGTTLCHNGCLGKDGSNVRHRLGRYKKTAVVLVDCGFIHLFYATTIEVFTSTPVRSLNG